ncbi:MAG: gliding motility-associated C-terminal domain-containing protein [Bacteroidota bacterium]|nr:gliding motility-associated C-terminal domain-containing protein [Bacteroidota bacterium]
MTRAGQAQREYFNWYFGQQAGLTFLTGPQALTNGVLSIPGDISCLSDAAGNYQFTSDGQHVWNRLGQLMPGGNNISGYPQAVMAVPQPGRPGRYYIFSNQNQVGHPGYRAGFGYAIVDMNQAGGLGAVLSDSIVDLPLLSRSNGAFLITNFVGVRHANGRDLWMVAQNLARQYVSFRLTAQGLQQPPVISPAPRDAVVIDLPSFGLLKASADGKTLAMSSHQFPQVPYNATSATSVFYHEIAAFQSQTGTVTNSYVIPDTYRQGHYKVVNNQFTWYPGVGGLELSPDGSKLYVDTLFSREVWQYNLLAGSPAAVVASRTVVARLAQPATIAWGSNMQMGPDGRIYLAGKGRFLGRFELPNAAGTASGYQDAAIDLGAGRTDDGRLPHATNDLNLTPVVIAGAGTVGAATGCEGSLVQFASSLSPFVTASAYHWNFGDPGSGPANIAAGQAPAHRYSQPGPYTVTLQVTATSGQIFSTSQQVTVLPMPQVSFGLPDSTTLCYGAKLLLNPGPQPAGTTFRWQDGSTGPELLVSQSGHYQVEATNAQGCRATARVSLKIIDCEFVLPNIITPNRDGQNDAFVLPGQDPSHWNIQIYSRWGQRVYQRTGYDNGWQATGQPAGIYFFLLTNPTSGQQLKGWLEVVK